MNQTLSSETKFEIWREAMAQLRHLNEDVWRGLTIFVTISVLNLAIVLGIFFFRPHGKLAIALATILLAAGFALTLAGRYILRRHRIYYLQMLAKKSLLETELGFYEIGLCGSDKDLAFPWRLTPEAVEEIKRAPEQWVQKSIRPPGSIAQLHFLIYEVLAGIYVIALLWLLLLLA